MNPKIKKEWNNLHAKFQGYVIKELDNWYVRKGTLNHNPIDILRKGGEIENSLFLRIGKYKGKYDKENVLTVEEYLNSGIPKNQVVTFVWATDRAEKSRITMNVNNLKQAIKSSNLEFLNQLI